jgi:primary-amine oxidase
VLKHNRYTLATHHTNGQALVDVSHTHGKRVTRVTEVTHPLDPLTESEIAAGRAILANAGYVTETVRFPAVLPVEPDKAATLAWKPGKPFDRSILFVLLDMATGISHEAVVSVTDEKVTSYTKVNSDVHPYGQPPYLLSLIHISEPTRPCH